MVQGLAVTQHFLGFGTGRQGFVRGRLEQLVVRRQDVLDLRRCARLLQHQTVDQHGLVGHALGHALQLGQGTAGGDGFFQDSSRLYLGGGRQGWQVVKGQVTVEHLADRSHGCAVT
jgi:hypothetical protein